MLTILIKNGDKTGFLSVVAAATENYDDSQDDDPSAVIVKEMAKAVVIHSMFLRSMFATLSRSLIYIICRGEKTVTDRPILFHILI